MNCNEVNTCLELLQTYVSLKIIAYFRTFVKQTESNIQQLKKMYYIKYYCIFQNITK